MMNVSSCTELTRGQNPTLRLPGSGAVCDNVRMSAERATLRSPDGLEHPLLSVYRVGRDDGCHLFLTDRRVSTSHASLRHWGRGAWRLRDLGSKNGTFLNGKRLESGRDTVLAKDDWVSFGDTASRWSFSPGVPNELIVVKLGVQGAFASCGDSLLALPGPEAARATVLRRSTEWVLEAPEAELHLSNGQVFSVEGTAYRVWISEEAPATEEVQRQLDNAQLRISFSQDEEELQAVLTVAGKQHCLPSRVYLHLLLQLARYREQDSAAGVTPAESGWRYADDVAREMKIDAQDVNVQVFRARRDIAKLGFADPASLIERRVMTRQIRLGIPAATRRLTT